MKILGVFQDFKKFFSDSSVKKQSQTFNISTAGNQAGLESLLIKAWWKLHLEQILKTDFHSNYLSFVFSDLEPQINIVYIFGVILM